MADARTLSHSIRQLRSAKTWQLLIILLLLSFLAATFLRMDNTGMVARRDAVLTADKAGDASAIEARLYELQVYSSSHMNADTGTFYLQEQYNRDVEKAVKASSGQSAVAADANAKAEAVCHPQYSGWSTAYMNCFLNELSKYPTASTLPTPNLPSSSSYRYSFASPIWSPGFAGFTILACALVIIFIIVRLVALLILRLMMRHHYRAA